MRKALQDSELLERPVFVWLITGLILFSAVCFCIETLPNLSESSRQWLRYAEVFVVLLFTLEYAVRILTARQRLRFVFSFYGLVDLLSILPFYLAFAVDLRSLRLLRLLRLVRILKLARYQKALRRFASALLLAREELVIFVAASLILIFLAAVGIYHFEHAAQPEHFRSIFDCLWWAVATLTTVGYGDIYPVTAGGRLFTFFILLIGIGLVAVPAGIIASALSAVRSQGDAQQRSQ